MKFVLEYKDEAVYEIEADSREEAMAQGDEWWAQRTPDVAVKEVQGRSRLDLLQGFQENAAGLKAAEEQRKANETNALIQRIRELKPRIDELIATGNACLQAGIPLTGKEWGGRESYETHQFITNSWSHLVGFVGSPSSACSRQITYLGINAGGAFGPWNFRTDGVEVFAVNGADVKSPSAGDMKKFLRDFDAFETAFYAYVDKEIEKQQKDVDVLLRSAEVRSEETDIGEASRGISAAKQHTF